MTGSIKRSSWLQILGLALLVGVAVVFLMLVFSVLLPPLGNPIALIAGGLVALGLGLLYGSRQASDARQVRVGLAVLVVLAVMGVIAMYALIEQRPTTIGPPPSADRSVVLSPEQRPYT